jgi:hypothetical protein
MVCVGLLSFWCIFLTVLVAKEKQILKELAKGVTKKDLVSLLKQISDSLHTASDRIQTIEQSIVEINQSNKSHFQKQGFVRFNPFSDTGGDQSFCLCLLDQENNGIVITSLHSRDATRLYAKEIHADSIKREEFSDEEWKSFEAAKQSKK